MCAPQPLVSAEKKNLLQSFKASQPIADYTGPDHDRCTGRYHARRDSCTGPYERHDGYTGPYHDRHDSDTGPDYDRSSGPYHNCHDSSTGPDHDRQNIIDNDATTLGFLPPVSTDSFSIDDTESDQKYMSDSAPFYGIPGTINSRASDSLSRRHFPEMISSLSQGETTNVDSFLQNATADAKFKNNTISSPEEESNTDPGFGAPKHAIGTACTDNYGVASSGELAEFIESTRGYFRLVHRGYVYLKDKHRTGVDYWHCENKQCKSRARTHALDGNYTSTAATGSGLSPTSGSHEPAIVTVTQEHNHQPDPYKVGALRRDVLKWKNFSQAHPPKLIFNFDITGKTNPN